ncbi:uncharacterized protein LOC141627820 [Silene latifolia]|uniref:uncharacterized protein LOC141627820 n=1 Tax=Silene latifolia TaxID=37657 RepID=UPI003D782327
MELVKTNFDVVPVWVKHFNIPLKFWGSCLPEIAGLVGKFVKKDQEPHDKTCLSYARVMVELSMDQSALVKVKFFDESGHMVFVPVEYEWKPISCTSYNGIGHNVAQCKKPAKKPPKPKQKQRQAWRPFKTAMVQDAVVEPVTTSPIITPTNFPPLHTVRSVPIQSTRAKNIMRLNRQETMVGVRLSAKFSNAQHIHIVVCSRADNKTFQLTMIYALNVLEERVDLWNNLKEISLNCNDPWLWLGDFNTVMSPVEGLGSNKTDAEMAHFQDVVYSRLDRAMGNQAWLDGFGDSYAHFHPEGLFDHCPCTVLAKQTTLAGKKNIKYINMWGSASQFKDIVRTVWSLQFQGTRMFSIIKKLKALKPALKSLNKSSFYDIENSTNSATLALENIQKLLVDNPGDPDLLQQEMDIAQDLRELI